MMELGCPALDKGSNQPNVFFDPKSSESQLPYFSNGKRDDLMQRRHITAFLGYWDPNDPDFVASEQPVLERLFRAHGRSEPGVHLHMGRAALSDVPQWRSRCDLSGRVVLTGTIPWADNDNWKFGHWITGPGLDRADQRGDPQDPERLCAHRCQHSRGAGGPVGLRDRAQHDAARCLAAARDNLLLRYGGKRRHNRPERPWSGEKPWLGGSGRRGGEWPYTAACERYTGQETELPGRARISYFNAAGDYESASVETLKLTGASNRVSSVSLAATARQSVMYGRPRSCCASNGPRASGSPSRCRRRC